MIDVTGVPLALSQEVESRLREIITSLRVYGAKRAWLVGSHARNQANEASDIDLIVEKETNGRFLDRLRDLYDLIAPRYALDLFVYTKDELQTMRTDGNRFIEHAMDSARLIYEDPAK